MRQRGLHRPAGQVIVFALGMFIAFLVTTALLGAVGVTPVPATLIATAIISVAFAVSGRAVNRRRH